MFRGLTALALVAALGPVGWYVGFIFCSKSCADGKDVL